MERRIFEDSLRDAFRDAEATPSDKVWTNVELELEKDNGADVRRRLIFYKMLAAAAVSLALLATGVAYVMVNDKNDTIEQMLAESKPGASFDNGQASAKDQAVQNGEVRSDNTISLPSSRELARAGADNSASEVAVASDNKGNVRGAQHLRDRQEKSVDARGLTHDRSVTDQNSASVNERPDAAKHAGPTDPNGIDTRTNSHGLTATNAESPASPNTSTSVSGVTTAAPSALSVANAPHESRALPEFYAPTIGQPSLNKTAAADPVALMMAKLAEEEMKLAATDDKRTPDSKEKVWTALGVAAGGFSAVNRSASPMQSSGLTAFSNTSVPDKQAKASGVAYSMGVSFGAKVASRWIVQGGVNYLTQSSNYVATNVIASPGYASLQAESINALGKLPALADAASASERLAPTVPYSVNNSLKYFSVPMQAGYLLVNRKFGVQLNAGISTDLFLENTITPEGGSLDKSTQSSGSDSPYRTVNLSGLMGTEFSYRLGQRYRIALNPALRYPLNSVYKSDIGIQSTPLTFDIGLRCRYIFK